MAKQITTTNDSFSELRAQMNQVFEKFITEDGTFKVPDVKLPALNLKETANEFHATLEIPGVNKKDIQIEVDHKLLTIKAEKQFSADIKKSKSHTIEHSHTAYSRTVAVPENIDENKVKASYKNGILEIIMPKSKQNKETKKKININ